MAMNTSKHPIPIAYMYYSGFLSPFQVLSDITGFFFSEYKIRNDLCGDLKELSSLASTTCVSQCLILGPILFLIYSKDIPDVVSIG